MLYCLGLSKCSKCKNTKNYQIKQEIRVFILNFGDYCLFYAVLDYSSLFGALGESKGFVGGITSERSGKPLGFPKKQIHISGLRQDIKVKNRKKHITISIRL